MKTRIEVDPETGDFYIIIPDDILEELHLEDGDVLEWFVDEDEIILTP